MKIYIAQEINEKTDYAVFTSKKECDKWIRENNKDPIPLAETGNIYDVGEGKEFEVKVVDFKLNKQSVLNAVNKIIHKVI